MYFNFLELFSLSCHSERKDGTGLLGDCRCLSIHPAIATTLARQLHSFGAGAITHIERITIVPLSATPDIRISQSPLSNPRNRLSAVLFTFMDNALQIIRSCWTLRVRWNYIIHGATPPAAT